MNYHKQQETSVVADKIMPAILGIACAVCAIYAMLNAPFVVARFSEIPKYNIISYIIMCLLFVLAVFALVNFTSYLSRKNKGESNVPARHFYFKTALLVFLFWCWQWTVFIREDTVQGNNSNTHLWHNIPVLIPLSCAMLCIAAAILVCGYPSRRRLRYCKSKALCALVVITAIMACLVGVVHFWYLNLPLTSVDAHHVHAVTNTIITVQNGFPYDASNVSIYGHYALFFTAVFKVIPFSMFHISFLFAILCVVAFVCFSAVSYFVSRSVALTIIGMCMYFFMAQLNIIYYQIWPLRILFPSLFLLFTVLYKKYKFGFLWGYLLAAAAIVFNTDTGIFCTAAWCLFLVYIALKEHSIWSAKFFKKAGIYVLSALGALLLAWQTTNLCNVLFLAGKPISLQYFIFPIFNNAFMDGVIEMRTPFSVNAWWFVLILHLVGVGKALLSTTLFRNISRKDDELLFFISISGLIQLLYFVNRPVFWNMYVSYSTIILCMLYFLKQALAFLRTHKEKTSLRGWYQGIAICLLSFMLFTAARSMTSVPNAVRTRFHSATEQQAISDMQLQAITDYVQLDEILAFGKWVPELYTMAGKQVPLAYMDFSDTPVNPQPTIAMLETALAKKEKPVLTSALIDPVMSRFILENTNLDDILQQEYTLEMVFPYNGTAYEYYVPKES